MLSMTMRMLPVLTAALLVLVPVASAQSSAPQQERIAILYFENNSAQNKELDALSKGLCSMMIADVKSSTPYQFVERDRIQEVLVELDMTRGAKFDQATAAKIGKLVGAQYLVFGSYFELLDKFQLSARIVKVETGVIVAAASSNGMADDFDVLQQKLTKDLFRKFDLARSVGGVRDTVDMLWTTDLDKRTALASAVKYSRALDEYDQGKKDSARKILMDIVDANPDFTVAKSMLAGLAAAKQ